MSLEYIHVVFFACPHSIMHNIQQCPNFTFSICFPCSVTSATALTPFQQTWRWSFKNTCPTVYVMTGKTTLLWLLCTWIEDLWGCSPLPSFGVLLVEGRGVSDQSMVPLNHMHTCGLESAESADHDKAFVIVPFLSGPFGVTAYLTFFVHHPHRRILYWKEMAIVIHISCHECVDNGQLT